MTVPVFSFVAYSNTGKTTYIEKLIPLLRGLGLRVAVVKHDAHRFEIDKEGKDSWRFSHAGAEVVAIASSEKFALIENRGPELDDILSHIRDVDIIITEGWKTGPYPKIGVLRAATGKPLALPPEQLLAVVADVPPETGRPCFPLDDPEPMARFLHAKVVEMSQGGSR